MANSGMQADVKKAKTTSLDEVKEKKKVAAQKAQAADPTLNQSEFTAKQVAREKEDGFEIIKKDVEPVAVKKATKKASSSPAGPSQKQQLDKKIGNFFRKACKKVKSSRRD
eukprot:243308_1